MNINSQICVYLRSSAVLLLFSPLVASADWPMVRGDAARSAATSDHLPDALHLQWVRKLPPQAPAWTDETGMQFDAGYHPIVLGGRVFVGSTVNDSFTAYDLESGKELWRSYTDGPIRVAPAGWRDRVFVASDDGHLHCVAAKDGKLLWRFRGGPVDRRLVGNERIISTWPCRGGPVVADDTVYFTAGVWPFMGTFVYALDAESGELKWSNDETSFSFRKLPHPGSTAFSGLSPQGHLAVAGEKLIVPGSRNAPAVFDRRNGTFLFYGEGAGTDVAVGAKFCFAGGQIFDCQTGETARIDGLPRSSQWVFGPKAWYASKRIFEASPSGGRIKQLGSFRATPWLVAGFRLVATDKGKLQLFDVSQSDTEPKLLSAMAMEGDLWDVLAADGKLLTVTRDGAVRCYGAKATRPLEYNVEKPQSFADDAWSGKAKEILRQAKTNEGYCLVLGLKDGGLVEALVRQSRLHVVAVDADAGRIERLRRRLDAAGLYGSRAAAIAADPSEIEFAPYLASVITSESFNPKPQAPGNTAGPSGPVAPVAYGLGLNGLRPYGGVAVFFDRGAAEPTVIRRDGPLPGSAPWLGQNADAGNTRCSDDDLVQPPLGVLWFGNALSNSLILPRHGEGPVEQVVGGRLFIEGPDTLNCADVYTGRLLWTKSFPGLGRLYNSTEHQPGAHTIGSNFFATADAIYVAYGKNCLMLDPATGAKRKEFQLPGGSTWQFLLVYEDLLIAGADPVIDQDQPEDRVYSPTSSRRIVVMDRHTGKVLWTRKAEHSFRHYSICAGRGKVFCIDRVATEEVKKLQRRGQTPKETPRIYALDANTGDVIWRTDRHVAGQLSYSAKHDILVSYAAFRGETGEVLWHHPEKEETLWFGKWGMMICGETIYPQLRRSFDLLTGEQRMWRTTDGKEQEWKYLRAHGCGPMAGSKHLITFRSACAGFLDTAHDGGTGNWGGFRSGCTSNLIAADGVLNAPDYSRTCGCGYQNRSSLALVHMPEVEYWTFGAIDDMPGRVGFNFGAPGDRRAESGTLWIASPNRPDEMLRDKSFWWRHDANIDPEYVPRPQVEKEPAEAQPFYLHSSRITGGDALPWVAASGMAGMKRLTIPLPGIDGEAAMTVRLIFAEPEFDRVGQRVFGVWIHGRPALEDFDIVRQAGGKRKALAVEVSGVKASGKKTDGLDTLEIEFRPISGEPVISGVEAIQE